MTIFLSILGLLFIITIVGFLLSDQFKEFRREQKNKPDERFLNNETLRNSTPYFTSVRNIRTDGFYLLKGDVLEYTLCYLESGYVIYFAEAAISSEESKWDYLQIVSKVRTITNSKYRYPSEIVGNELIFTIKNMGNVTTFICKLKQNGQLQVYQDYIDENGEHVTEWSDYDFVEFTASSC